ncbi:hypothetical protein LJJ44_20515 [Pseudomonas sp. B24_DOA]|nr:hypothetical protein LJJ44_20515 [Pseudomonas sp. B24_DOA]WKV89114.1 hypothetical protein LJU32_00985 [Pseudomonas sp. B21_DOA]
MSTAIINNEEFTANLYLDGRPLVLNQYRLQEIVRDPRITQREKLDAQVGLASLRLASFITLADHEDHKPLLFRFVSQKDGYAISVVHSGKFGGARLFIEDKTHNLLVSTSAPLQHFSMSTLGATKTSLSHIEAGPAYIELCSEPKSKPMYRNISDGMSTFLDADPNLTTHNAFNNKPAQLVIKVIKASPSAA